MFKSIKYLRLKYDAASSKYTYYYYLVDSEFECEVSAAATSLRLAPDEHAMTATAAEYKKRKLPLIKNVYLLNNHLLNEWHSASSFENLLNYQNRYTDEYYTIPGINFSKDIYPKLLEMHKELLAFK